MKKTARNVQVSGSIPLLGFFIGQEAESNRSGVPSAVRAWHRDVPGAAEAACKERTGCSRLEGDSASWLKSPFGNPGGLFYLPRSGIEPERRPERCEGPAQGCAGSRGGGL